MDSPIAALSLLSPQSHPHPATSHHIVPPAAWGGYLRPEDGISPEQNRLIILVALPLNLLSILAALSVFFAILYLRRHYPRLADRVSLRLTLATAFVDILYHLFQMISDLAEPIEGNFWCTFSVWGYVWASLLSVFLTAALALNLQLVWFHKILLPISFERLYYSLALAASLFASVPPWIFGAYGADEVEGTCWFRDLGSHTALFWQWTSLFGWLCLSILYCSVALALVSWKLWEEHNGDDDYDGDEDDEDSLPEEQEGSRGHILSPPSSSRSGEDSMTSLWGKMSRRFSKSIHPIGPAPLGQRGRSGGRLEVGDAAKAEENSSNDSSHSHHQHQRQHHHHHHPAHNQLTHPSSRSRGQSNGLGHWMEPLASKPSSSFSSSSGSLGLERSASSDHPSIPPAILESSNPSPPPKIMTSSASSSSSSATLLTPTSGTGGLGTPSGGSGTSGDLSGKPSQNRYSTASTLYSSSTTLCPSSVPPNFIPPAYRVRADRAAAKAARRRQRKIRRQIHAAVARIALYPIIPILTQSLNVISVMDAYATARVSFPLYFASFCATGSQGLLNAIVFLCDPAIHNSWRVVREDALAHARSQRILGRETLISRLTFLFLSPSSDHPFSQVTSPSLPTTIYPKEPIPLSTRSLSRSSLEIMEPHFPLYRSQLNASMERNVSSSSVSSVSSSASSITSYFHPDAGSSEPSGETSQFSLSSITTSSSSSSSSNLEGKSSLLIALTPPATALTRAPAPTLPYAPTTLDRVDEEAELAMSGRNSSPPSSSSSSPPTSPSPLSVNVSSNLPCPTSVAPSQSDGNGYARHIRFL
ncbi:MAG: hypothetical protein DHS80DRAFT_22472 [Piptocephalis tieghemiana]|nr:MAG: hypothetical protein DHS80DRAFT_22472 [Piptocephalis tieghemiana]